MRGEQNVRDIVRDRGSLVDHLPSPGCWVAEPGLTYVSDPQEACLILPHPWSHRILVAN